jgi:hypothetical protein
MEMLQDGTMDKQYLLVTECGMYTELWLRLLIAQVHSSTTASLRNGGIAEFRNPASMDAAEWRAATICKPEKASPYVALTLR